MHKIHRPLDKWTRAKHIKKLFTYRDNLSELAMNAACDEMTQMSIFTSASSVHEQLATNPSLAPSVQILIERSKQLTALPSLMQKAINSLHETRYKHINIVIARRGKITNKQGGDIIQDVNCIQDLIDNKISREYEDELLYLRHLLGFLKNNAS